MIPKLIHQIWFGTLPTPINSILTWRRMHPDWNYKLWKEDNLPVMRNQTQFEWATRLDKKGDMARLEILYQYGGIYADCDFVCLKSFAPLLNVPFFAGYQWTYKKGGGVICNALIGVTPRHPLIKQLIEQIHTLTQEQCASSTAVKLTGPFLLTKMWNEYKGADKGVIHPPSFFYPIRDKDFVHGELPVDWKFQTTESYAVHLWKGQFGY